MSGKIHRIKTTEDFVILRKNAIQSKDLSWKAKGLHCYLMQLPSDWNINVSDLSNRSTDGRDSTAAALNELIEAGYATRKRVFDEKKRFAGYDYDVFETKNGKAVNGKAVNGKAVNGKAVNGKAVTTKKEVDEELILLSNNIERSAPEKFDGTETDFDFKKIGSIEINENPVSVNTGKTEQDAPGAGPTRAEYEKAVDEYFEADKPQEAIRSDDPNPVETATQISVRFMQTNPDTVKLWCENAKFTGTPADLITEMRKFFSYYQSINPEHQANTRPEFWFTRSFQKWLIGAKHFNHTSARQELAKRSSVNGFGGKEYSKTQLF